MEIDSVITHMATLFFGALVTLGGAVVAFLKHKRESDVAAGQDIREELRKELREAKKEREEVRKERDQFSKDLILVRQEHFSALKKERDAHAKLLQKERIKYDAERQEYQKERKILKMALDKRDRRIDTLDGRVSEIEVRSEPLGLDEGVWK